MCVNTTSNTNSGIIQICCASKSDSVIVRGGYAGTGVVTGFGVRVGEEVLMDSLFRSVNGDLRSGGFIIFIPMTILQPKMRWWVEYRMCSLQRPGEDSTLYPRTVSVQKWMKEWCYTVFGEDPILYPHTQCLCKSG